MKGVGGGLRVRTTTKLGQTRSFAYRSPTEKGAPRRVQCATTDWSTNVGCRGDKNENKHTIIHVLAYKTVNTACR